jgi:tRNA dimethylallyltransferase
MKADEGRPIRLGLIVGPTATGKSALAVELAERIGAEIVNADSRQLYLGMDIGTAKPTAEQRARAPHHLLDVCPPDQPLDAARFAALARCAIEDITRRGHPVIVCGGSGLYIKALLKGIFPGPAACPELRRQMLEESARYGPGYLHDRLREVDPVAAERIAAHDQTRLLRALEVFRLTGTPLSVYHERHGFAETRYETVTIGLNMERKQLYEEIDRRFDALMAVGFLDEVRTLLGRGYNFERAPLSTIGYRHLAAYLRGAMELIHAVEIAKRDTRRFAKRQLTWFRRDGQILWMTPEQARLRAPTLFSRFLTADRVGEIHTNHR